MRPDRSETRLRLRNLLILVYQPLQHLPVPHSDRAHISDQCRKRVAVGWTLPAALMWPVFVVMRQIPLSTASRWPVL
jgi:hypothetical protein